MGGASAVLGTSLASTVPCKRDSRSHAAACMRACCNDCRSEDQSFTHFWTLSCLERPCSDWRRLVMNFVATIIAETQARFTHVFLDRILSGPCGDWRKKK